MTKERNPNFTYATWDAGLPCRNPNCKSHGRPHPNCRCYQGLPESPFSATHMAMQPFESRGETPKSPFEVLEGTEKLGFFDKNKFRFGFAEGGEVNFCSLGLPHKPDCEYYADGGPTASPTTSDFWEESGKPTNESVKSDFWEEGEAKPDESIGEQIGAGLEGASKGVAGPIVPAVEIGLSKLGVPGVSAEEQAARAEKYPLTSKGAELGAFSASTMFGKGPFAAVQSASEAATASKFLQAAIQSGFISGSDEISKMLLGQGDPNESVASRLMHVPVAALFGGIVGKGASVAGSAAQSKLAQAAESKFGQQAQYFLHGISAAANGTAKDIGESLEVLPASARKGFEAGARFFDSLNKYSSGLGAVEGAKEGYEESGITGIPAGAIKGLVIGGLTGAGVKLGTTLTNKIAAPVVMKMLSSGTTQGMIDTFDHAINVAAGSQALDKAIDSVMKVSPAIGEKAVQSIYEDKNKERIDKLIRENTLHQSLQNQMLNDAQSPQAYAEGGEVKPKETNHEVAPIHEATSGLATHYPAEHVLMSAARGRVYNYLNSLRPQANQPRLPFDSEPNNKEQKRKYHQAIDIAAHPLGVLEEIKRGTFDQDKRQHLNALYPEVTELIKKRLTQKITEAQLNGEKPPFHVRQGLSLLLGTPLSSDFTQQNIAAAQSVFTAQAAAAAQSSQPETKSSGSKKSLSKSEQSYMTQGQALVTRQQHQKS